MDCVSLFVCGHDLPAFLLYIKSVPIELKLLELFRWDDTLPPYSWAPIDGDDQIWFDDLLKADFTAPRSDDFETLDYDNLSIEYSQARVSEILEAQNLDVTLDELTDALQSLCRVALGSPKKVEFAGSLGPTPSLQEEISEEGDGSLPLVGLGGDELEADNDNQETDGSDNGEAGCVEMHSQHSLQGVKEKPKVSIIRVT